LLESAVRINRSKKIIIIFFLKIYVFELLVSELMEEKGEIWERR